MLEKKPEEPDFADFRKGLKKSQTVKREIKQDEMEKVSLKKHQFETEPLNEQVAYFSISFKKTNQVTLSKRLRESP